MSNGHSYEAVTDKIRVLVEPVYLPDQSRPQDSHWVWAYIINVANEGAQSIQLRRRHWIITDANGHTIEVEGEGVVGEQPVIPPGGKYEYTSGTPLKTAHGIMRGSYQMERPDGAMIDVEIPAFALDQPNSKPLAN